MASARDVEMVSMDSSPSVDLEGGGGGDGNGEFGNTSRRRTSTLMQQEEEQDDDLVVVADNVHKTYLLGAEGVAALRGVSLKVRRGELLMLYGTSGGGKTTLLNCIGTIDKPTKGYIKVAGLRINHKTEDKDLALLRLAKLGFVFQSFNLISSLTALENVEMPMVLRGILSASQRRARAIELLEKVGMGKRLDHLPSQLSGGEQQRVTIARALSNQPELLLLDEPTGDLDSKNTEIVLKMLLELNQQDGITMVMVTHDMSLKHLADRVVHLRDGRLHREEVTEVDRKMAAREGMISAGAAAISARSTSLPISDASSRDVPFQTEIRRPRDYATHVASACA